MHGVCRSHFDKWKRCADPSDLLLERLLRIHGHELRMPKMPGPYGHLRYAKALSAARMQAVRIFFLDR
jgi:hypothetical protein